MIKKRILLETIAAFVLLNIVISMCFAKEEPAVLKSELLSLEDIKQELEAFGIGVSRISDLITEGFIHFNNQDYNRTRVVINSIYDLRDLAISTYEELDLVNQLYLEVRDNNISQHYFSQTNISDAKIEWDLEYAEREFEKENYEEAQRVLAETKKVLFDSIHNKYSYLNYSLLSLEEKIDSHGMSKARITVLKALLSESIEKGMLEELELIRHEATELDKSLSSYEEIKLAITGLESMNYSAQRLKDGLHAAELDLSLIDYDSAQGKLDDLKALAENAFYLDKEITEFGETLKAENAKHDEAFRDSSALLEEAKAAEKVGNYEEASERLLSAQSAFETAKAELLVKSAGLTGKGLSLREFLENNWQYALLAALIIIISFIATRKTLSYQLMKKQMAALSKQLRVSDKMIKDLQKNYFVHKKMSRENYDASYDSLQEKILRLKEKTALLNKKIKKHENKPLAGKEKK